MSQAAALLVEFEELIRTSPERFQLHEATDENFQWLGRVAAAIEHWNSSRQITVQFGISQLSSKITREDGLRTIFGLLYHARTELQRTLGLSPSVAIGKGQVFEYFDELRKVIEGARSDLLFIDPYLDAEFVSRYLPFAAAGIPVRLLTDKKLPTLLPAVDAFVAQHKCVIQVRSSAGLHDRYLIIDGQFCYQSGASFKDGVKNALTTLTRITDVFQSVRTAYESMWAAAKIERPLPP